MSSFGFVPSTFEDFVYTVNDTEDTLKGLGCDKKTIIKFPKFIQFDTEIKTIQKKLTKHYPAIWTTIKRKNNDSDNRYGKFMSHLCFQIENKYLQKVVSTIKPNILMFDGFMIDKTKIDRKKMISDLNKETKGIVRL